MDALYNGAAWVVLTFSDGTKQCIYTTLCPSYCAKTHVKLKEGYFFDLLKNEYIPFREDAVEIEVFSDKPKFDEEVLRFASRFI